MKAKFERRLEMETAKRTVILLIFALLTTVVAQSADTSPAKPPATPAIGISDTRTASCLVKITADAAVLPLDQETIYMLLQSSGVAGKAVREVLGLSPDRGPGLFEIAPTSGGFENAPVSTTVGVSPAASEAPASPQPYGVPSQYSSDPMTTLTHEPIDSKADSPATVATPKTRMSTFTQRGQNTVISAGRSVSRPSSPDPTTASPSQNAEVGNRYGSRRASTGGGYSSYSYGTAPTEGPYSSYSYGTAPAGGGYGSYSYGTAPETVNKRGISDTSILYKAEQTVIFHLSVSLPDEVDVLPLAEQFMVALITNLKEALERAFADSDSRLGKRLNAAEAEARRAEEELLKRQSMLRDIAGGGNLSRNTVLARISDINQDLQALKMQKASNDAMIKQTSNRIAQTGRSVQEQLKADAITTELESIIKLNEEQLAAVQQQVKARIASAAEIAQPSEKLARARIELAMRRQELSKSAGGDLLASLNDELASLAIGATQYDAQMQSLQEQLRETEGLVTKADDYELLSLKADIIRHGLQESLLWRDQLERRKNMLLPPVISVIGGE
jgi:hypothetical protein